MTHRGVFVGLARDCEPYLPSVLRQIDDLGSLFSEYWVVIGENGSQDRSLELLRRWEQRRGDSRFTVVVVSAADEISDRFHRLALLRNHVHKVAEALCPPEEGDTQIVMDLDEVNAWVDVDGFAEALRELWSNPWGGLTANQQGVYYDRWALVTKGAPKRCMEGHWGLCWGLVPYSIEIPWLWASVGRIPADARPFPVISAFGGMAIYRRDAILGSAYSGTLGRRSVCEHVPFHIDLAKRTGLSLGIAPCLLNRGPDASNVRTGAYPLAALFLGSLFVLSLMHREKVFTTT